MVKTVPASVLVLLLCLGGCQSPISPPAPASPLFGVIYNANTASSGTVPTDHNSYVTGALVTVLGNPGNLIKGGFYFVGWNTTFDGTGVSYAAGNTFTMGQADARLFAHWSQTAFKVTYHADFSTGGGVPLDTSNYQANATVTVLGNPGNLVRTGFAFDGWNTKPDGTGTLYQTGSQLILGTADVDLYPSWATPYNVLYSSGEAGGSPPADTQNYPQDGVVTVMGNTGPLTSSGNTFAGWNTKSDGSGTSYAAGAAFTIGPSNVTLYPVWISSQMTFTSVGTAITLTGFSSTPTGSLTIPAGVTAVGPSAFQNCTGVSGLTIPPSVSSIGKAAFEGTMVVTVSLPSGLAVLGDGAFADCTKLTSIAIDAANPYFQSIGGVLFNKSGTILLQVPAGLAGTSYAVPLGVTAIGNNAFLDCLGLTSVTIPASVQTIGDYAFLLCSGLSSVAIPSSVTTIGTEAFLDAGLSGITIPSSVTSIGAMAFLYDGNLTRISVDSANANYESISGVLFDKTGQSLIQAPGALSGSYVVPGSVTDIGQHAFANCIGLTGVTLQSATPPTLVSGSGAFSGESPGFLIHVPTSLSDAVLTSYQSTSGWSEYASLLVSP